MMQNHYNYEQMLKGMAPLYCNIIFVTPNDPSPPLPKDKKRGRNVLLYKLNRRSFGR